jgi:UDP-hydrolysing UDP-N-acetyl-D-glucosamine 2-epimerase
MHLSPEYGSTIREVEASGFAIAERIEMCLSSRTPVGAATSLGVGVAGFAQALQRSRPDLLLVLGDRYEMFAAVSAAALLTIPLAHLHGGESTEGAVDETFRHAITKMSHLHFVSHPHYAARVIQMGEDPWRVTVSGAPALDAIRAMRLLSPRELRRSLRVGWKRRPLLATFHPATGEPGQAEDQFHRLCKAVLRVPGPVVWTYPNADAEGGRIIQLLEEFGAANPARVRVVKNLGPRAYYSLMRHSWAMVGNSSSGIIEAAGFELPVVNVGRRQQGRLHGINVVNVGNGTAEILRGLRRVSSPDFTRSLRGMKNPYGDGRAADRIVRVLERVELAPGLLRKRFRLQEGR